MSKIWFTSDLHFSHKNINKFCPAFRPKNYDELNEYMIEQWNNVVAPEDIVYNLGDVSFASNFDDLKNVLYQLNGTHHLILGNHDSVVRQNIQKLLNSKKHDGLPLLSSIRDYQKVPFILDDKKINFVLFHYPIEEWDGCHRGAYHLYGHLHERIAQVGGRALNVGWDLHGRFLSLEDVHEFLKDLPVRKHGGEAKYQPSTTEEAKTYVKKQLALMSKEVEN